MVESPPAGLFARLNRTLGLWVASPAFLVVVVVCGVIARVRQYLSVRSYWYDEAFLVLAVRDRSYAELLGRQPYDLVIPPLFLWLSRALYQLGGDGELVMRLPAFLAGILALLLIIPLARRVIGTPHALWPVVWLAVCRTALTHGSEVRGYTVDLAVAEGLMWAAAAVLTRPRGARVPAWAWAGLAAGAAVAVWLSFASAFVLAGVSLAAGIKLFRDGTRRGWLAWGGFNAVVALSAAGLWWVSARHMYYPNTVEQWGHNGWHGFPDWGSTADVATWLVTRPVDVGNYGNRELGIVLTVLAVVGGVSLARRSRSLLALLVAPVALAVVAALLGKYPLAHRTGFFLLPCLWLLAAEGVRATVGWWERRGWRPAAFALVLVAWDAIWLSIRIVQPAESENYRGAYHYVHEHRQPGDLMWSDVGVVHDVYYGIGTEPLMGQEFEEAHRRAKGQRVWLVISKHRGDWRERLAEAGEMSVPHRVYGLDVILVEPKPVP